MSQLINLDPKLFSRLPNELINEICVTTGKFILRYDKKLNKTVLVSIIDLTEPQWFQFNIILGDIFFRRNWGRRFNFSISRNGDLVRHTYLRITLPPSINTTTHITDHSELPSNTRESQQEIIKNTKKRRRRGDKQRFKMQFK